MLGEKLEILQQQMMLKLEQIRKSYEHKGNKGTNVEQIVREFLREFLPPYNRVGHGEVIDTFGGRSPQLDVVITNEYHPYLNDLTQPSVYFVEGVAAVGEVKSILVGDELDTILDNSARVKALKQRLPKGTITFFTKVDEPRFLDRRAYFLFAFESPLTLKTIRNRINDYIANRGIPIYEQIDGVFILSRGWLLNAGDGKGRLRVKRNGNDLTGINGSESGNALFSLLAFLSLVMPRIVVFGSILHPYIFPPKT